MAKTTIKSIYQQSDKLEEQRPFWHFMKSKERTIFIKEIRALLVTAQRFEQSTNDRSAKNRLRNILDIWEEFLDDINNTSVRDLAVISKFNKTSPAPTESRAEEFSIMDFIHNIWVNIARPLSQPLSHGKIDHNSPPSIPHNPEHRAMFNKFYGVVDSNRNTE